MIFQKRNSGIYFNLILSLILVSCVKEEFNPRRFDGTFTMDPGLAIPVGHSTLKLEKYIADAGADSIINEDGFLILRYSRNVVSGDASDLFTIPDEVIGESILNETGFDLTLPPGSPPVELTDTFGIPISFIDIQTSANANIDSIRFLSGDLSINLNSPGLTGTISYEFSGLNRDNIPVTIHANLSEPNTSISLENCSLTAAHDGSGINLLYCIANVVLEGTTGSIPDGSELFRVEIGLSGLNYDVIFGDFEGFEIPVPRIRYNPDIFEQVVQGSFEFKEPEISLIFSNSFGVAAGIAFREIETVDQNQVRHPLSGPGVPTPQSPEIIAYPDVSQLGEMIMDTITINNTNSNLPEVLGFIPDLINLTVFASMDPPGEGKPAFIKYNSHYSVDASFKLPIWGKAEILVLNDVLKFVYLSSNLPVPEELERLTVRVNIRNGFPVSVTPQLYLMDENLVVLDSIFTDQEIKGSTKTDNNGKVFPTNQTLNVDLSTQKIRALRDTHYIKTQGSIKTSGYPDYVKFYADYSLEYNIGLIAQLKIDTGK